MAAQDLCARADVIAYAAIKDPDTAALYPIIDRLITAASDLFRNATSRAIVKATYTSDLYDGDDARGKRGELWLREYPIYSVTSVKENGVALTIGNGYSPSSDVLTVGMGTERDGYLLRQTNGGAWRSGRQNIEVTYAAGYEFPRAGTSGVPQLPFDVEHAVAKLAALMFRERDRLGERSKTFANWSVSYIRTLGTWTIEADEIMRIIGLYERGFRP